jgi:hypothetical protein
MNWTPIERMDPEDDPEVDEEKPGLLFVRFPLNDELPPEWIEKFRELNILPPDGMHPFHVEGDEIAVRVERGKEEAYATLLDKRIAETNAWFEDGT